jgi:hypothetical protein
MGSFLGLGKVAKAVGKVAGSVVKVAAGVVSNVVKAVPVVGQIYNVATSVIGVDPIAAVGGALGSGLSGKNIVSGLKDGLTGGLVSALFPASVSPGDPLPETSKDPPGVYTYEDGSYAYTVNADGKVVYNPSDIDNPPANAVVEPNGSLSAVPASLGAKAVYIQQLLNSYGDPLGVDKANMILSAVNNFVVGQNPLDGAQQSNLIALDVVNQSPEALSYTAQALQQTTGKSAVDWIALLTGLWNTAKNANIPGVSDAVKKAEDQIVGTVVNVAEESFTYKIGRFFKDNMLLIAGGVLGLVLLIVFLGGKRSR